MKKIINVLLCVIFIITALSSVTYAKTGDVIGYAKYTDISAYINHYPITSYNINGNTAIIAEDLQNYGFNVVWDGTKRTLSIKRSEATTITPINTVFKYTKRAGQNSFPIYETDIVTYVNGSSVKSFSIGGKTCIYMDSLTPYGNVAWVSDIRAIKLWIDGLPIAEYKALEEEPVTTLYAADGRTKIVANSEVEAYKNVGWYLTPVTTMYASDGRTVVVSKDEISAYKNSGWYETKEQAQSANKSTKSTKTSFTSSNPAPNGNYYRTPTGKRYHLDPNCGGKNSYRTTNISGLSPCSKCAK